MVSHQQEKNINTYKVISIPTFDTHTDLMYATFKDYIYNFVTNITNIKIIFTPSQHTHTPIIKITFPPLHAQPNGYIQNVKIAPKVF